MSLTRSRRLPLLLLLCVAATSFLLASRSRADTGALSDPAEQEAPDMLLDPCVERAERASGSPLSAAFEAHDDEQVDGKRSTAAFKRFKGKALRLRRAGADNPFQPYWTRHHESFEVWTPQARKLDREEALRVVGASDVAARHQFAVTLTNWTWALTFGATFAMMAGGFAAGAAAGYMFPDPTLTTFGSAMIAGTLGMTIGLFGLLIMPATWGIAALLRADDGETLDNIQAYNREQANEAGLDEAEIPFTFLGY